MSSLRKLLDQSFPLLLESELKDKIAEVGHLKTINEGESMMDFGEQIKAIPLVVDGRIKIFREDEDGHELFLYYLYPGEACSISLVCTINDKISQVKAIALEETKVVVIPIEYMDFFMMNFRSWYQYVVRSYASRMQELLKTIDSIAFRNMDERLLEYLENKAEAIGSSVIRGTHQEIAIELNSSREVISRLLKQMEKKGLVKLSRNQVELLD